MRAAAILVISPEQFEKNFRSRIRILRSVHMKFEFNWPCGFWEKYVFIILMGLQFESTWLKGQKSFEINLSHYLTTYQMRIMTLAEQAFKN